MNLLIDNGAKGQYMQIGARANWTTTKKEEVNSIFIYYLLLPENEALTNTQQKQTEAYIIMLRIVSVKSE